MQAINSHEISKTLLDKLRQAFPQPRVRPGQAHDEIMYAAGQHEVVRFIEQYLGQKGALTVHGFEPETTAPDEQRARAQAEEKTPWWKR